MSQSKQAVKELIKKLEFNPVDLGGKTKYTTKLGIILGLIVIIFVLVYAVGKFAVIDGSANTVTNVFYYQNDPYQINLSNWNIRFSIFDRISNKFATPQNILELGLNITAFNVNQEQIQAKSASSPIVYEKQQNKLTVDTNKTPLIISGSKYVYASPTIKQYLIQFRFCQQKFNPKCNQDKNRNYYITLFMQPKWPNLHSPKQPAVNQIKFNEKFLIQRNKPAIQKRQITYDVNGFNITSDTSYLPSFIPRNILCDNGSSLASNPTKIYLPEQSQSFLQFIFRRTGNSQAYTRKFNPIDVIFADILGIVALFGLILWILLSHYNTWGSQQYILQSILGEEHSRDINLIQYLKFYFTCKKRTKKEIKVLKQVHQDIIQSYKERKRMKIQVQVLKLRALRLQNQLKIFDSEGQCKKQILLVLEQQQKQDIYNSSVLTQQIRENLLKN